MSEAPQKIVVVLNPMAGRGRGAKQRAELTTLLQRHAPQGVDWSLLETTRQGEATGIARNAAQKGATCVAAAGGDGTLCEVLNGVFGTKTRLALLPLGTGNDCARTLGLNTDLELAVRTLFSGTPKPVDVGHTQGRYFLNVAGCGFDAIVADRINRGIQFLHGMPAYLLAILLSLKALRSYPLRLHLDGETREVRAALCSVANTRSYGGGLLIAPDALMDDGLFDICLICEVGRLEFLRAFPMVLSGAHTRHPKVQMLRAKSLRVESETPLPVLIDGEVVGTTPVEFVLHPRAIEIMTPQFKDAE